jgi:hypothetical protein
MQHVQRKLEVAAQEAFGNMTPMVNKALKGATVGASIGLLLWMGKQLLPSPPAPAPFEELNASANEALLYDLDVRGMCDRMKQYQKLDESSFTNFLLGWAQLLNLNVQLQRGEVQSLMKVPYQCAKYGGIVVEAVRRMRAFVVKSTDNNPAIIADFDELAGNAQRRLNEYQHNITKQVEYLRMQ